MAAMYSYLLPIEIFMDLCSVALMVEMLSKTWHDPFLHSPPFDFTMPICSSNLQLLCMFLVHFDSCFWFISGEAFRRDVATTGSPWIQLLRCCDNCHLHMISHLKQVVKLIVSAWLIANSVHYGSLLYILMYPYRNPSWR